MDRWSEANRQAVEMGRKAVAHIVGQRHKDGSVTLGSGTFIDRRHVLTSAQLGEKGWELTVRTPEGRKFPAYPVATDPLYGLALLRLEGRAEEVLPPLLNEEELFAGRIVLALGDSFGQGVTANMGVVVAADRSIYRPERLPVDGLIVTDALVHPGNIGGPLVTLDGQVAGVSILSWMHGLSLAVQAETAWRVANQIIEYGEATHAWLGFGGEAQEVDPAVAQLFALPVKRGVAVTYVAEDGPGARAGVQPLDLVVYVDGQPVHQLGAIRRLLSRRRPGERATLTVLRGGDLLDLSIEVENMPNLAQADNG
ncbi:MAG: S1C family serine protease [Clostridiales bacterium]|nr:S1C family serine protease [Clostridiales bacterium]